MNVYHWQETSEGVVLVLADTLWEAIDLACAQWKQEYRVPCREEWAYSDDERENGVALRSAVPPYEPTGERVPLTEYIAQCYEHDRKKHAERLAVFRQELTVGGARVIREPCALIIDNHYQD